MVEELKKDMVEAMKNHEKERLAVIRAVKAGMDKERIDNKREVNDELLIDVVNREIKMRKESIVEFEKGNREDLIAQYNDEISILQKYLPEQLSMEEVNKIIDEIFDEDMNQLEVARHPEQILKLKFDFELPAYSMLRLKKKGE